jgi:regulator of cell morphogenesis and NO signaling
MPLTADALVADIASTQPATIAVFQRHHIDFCCGGKIPLQEACQHAGVNTAVVMEELQAALSPVADTTDLPVADLTTLIGHIQQRYHQPLREELPRLAAMLARVVSRHGDRHGATLLPLQRVFEHLQAELLSHMAKEDAVLFPAIVALESGPAEARPSGGWLAQPIHAMEADHEAAGAALARMRELTGSYTPPAGACPTFRGLYFGLWQLEQDMHVHIHLENNILFPRAASLAHAADA